MGERDSKSQQAIHHLFVRDHADPSDVRDHDEHRKTKFDARGPFPPVQQHEETAAHPTASERAYIDDPEFQAILDQAVQKALARQPKWPEHVPHAAAVGGETSTHAVRSHATSPLRPSLKLAYQNGATVIVKDTGADEI